MPTESLSIFSRRLGTIHYSSSSVANSSTTAASCTLRGSISWRRTSKDLTLTVSKLQYAPPTRSPRVLQVIPLKDGHLIVVGPEEAQTGGRPSGTRSASSASDYNESTSTT